MIVWLKVKKTRYQANGLDNKEMIFYFTILLFRLVSLNIFDQTFVRQVDKWHPLWGHQS